MNKKNIKKRNLLAATNKNGGKKIIVIGSKLIYIYDLFSPLETIVKINLQHKQIPYFIFVISFFACCIYIRSDVRGRVHLDDNNTCTDISTEKMIKFKTKT